MTDLIVERGRTMSQSVEGIWLTEMQYPETLKEKFFVNIPGE